MFDDQAMHVSYIINEVKQRGKRSIEVSAEAEEAWVQEIVRLAGTGPMSFLNECTPGYYNREGTASTGSRQNAGYAPGINVFNNLLKDWRETGELEGMVLT